MRPSRAEMEILAAAATPAAARPDIVIVGGGIAGAALATVLARAGRAVLVLEATETFRDRVRGESLMPWGVAEAQALGVADLLVAAGGHIAPLWKRYSQDDDRPRDLPVGALVRGVAGSLNLHHPLACQALLDAAAAAGAVVLRGVREVQVQAGIGPAVQYRHGGIAHRVRPSLVVGADGRQSAVRRCVGIALAQQAATTCVAGLLLDGVAGPDRHDVVMEHDLGLCLLLRQAGGRARAYHVLPIEQQKRYAGAEGPGRFLADASAPGSPLAATLADARPAGPCAAVAGTDTWTDQPCVDGVVLIGDAAGHNDPGVGCGLSIALRDVRLVRDLLLQGAQRAAEFAAYGTERSERLRRLRLIGDLVAVATVEPGPRRSARRSHLVQAMAGMDPAIAPLVLGMFAGPETIPTPLVNDAVLSNIRAV